MRKTLTLLLLAPWSLAQGANLTLTIQEIRTSEGNIRIQVLPSEAAFAGDAPPARALVLPAVPPEVSVTLDGLASGSYGVRLMHDVNGNEELDTNLVGMPKEPFGFSNNAPIRFGAPKWDAIKFDVEGDTSQTIKLTH